MTEVKFSATRAEMDAICNIMDRARSKGYVRGPAAPDHWYEPSTMLMDLDAVHSNGCPMDFDRLLEGDDFNFLHDVAGIARHIDRDTGKLGDSFLPRFHKREG